MTNCARLVVLATALPFAAFAQPISPSPVPTNADDCASIAVMLGAPLPDLPGNKGDMAAGSYGVDCDWKALRVKPPAIATVKSKYFFWFVKPNDPNDGQKRRIERDQGFGGKGKDERGGTLVVGYCDAEKKSGKWQLVTCESGMYFTPDKISTPHP